VWETAASAEPGSAETTSSGVSRDAGSEVKMHLESLPLDAMQVIKHHSPAPYGAGWSINNEPNAPIIIRKRLMCNEASICWQSTARFLLEIKLMFGWWQQAAASRHIWQRTFRSPRKSLFRGGGVLGEVVCGSRPNSPQISLLSRSRLAIQASSCVLAPGKWSLILSLQSWCHATHTRPGHPCVKRTNMQRHYHWCK
jgi:hypothetical protein